MLAVLVITGKVGEMIRIIDRHSFTLKVLECGAGQVKLVFDAPEQVVIVRDAATNQPRVD